MGKLTLRLIKYFIGTISAVVIICMILSGLFLSLIYTNIQYSEMKTASEKIYIAAKNGTSYSEIITEYQITNGFIVKDGKTELIASTMMGMMRNMELSGLGNKGRYSNPRNQELLYYKTTTDIGDIIVFQNDKFSSVYMKYTYYILGVIFFIALAFAVPIVTILGKRITKPVIMLQRASHDITKGNYNIELNVNTRDEIQDLSESIKSMAASLEKKDVMQRDFIANVTHDFKTPLSVIRNYSEAVYDNILKEDEKKEYLKVIISEVDRLNFLVNDILKLSKLQSGKDTINKEYFSLYDFVHGFKELFKIQMNQKNITFNIVDMGFDAGTNISIFGDSKYLERVIYNFLDNAIKFSNINGTIELGVVKIEAGLKIYVKDNGVGIASDLIDDIWKMYYKNESSGGMGLGLAICSEILKIHNFSYGVESKVGFGSEFYFIVPKESSRVQ